MFDSLLVANRGEIACRIFRSARRLGLRTIAVFSDVDASARHVREADEAIRIGPTPARESYLDIERILDAARATGAKAIHPGYGFLSENARFAQACADAGLVFVGPPAAAIAAMGSKIAAKSQMRAAGVPVLPGYEGSRQDLAVLEREALSLGMPLIIKPAAGGGGKGMRIVRQESELGEALAGARRLAESAFGDGALLLERYLPAPRHVEVQVFADSHGNFVQLGDRDCSIQRRHQKLIEEAPAPNLPDDVRARLRAAAVLVAREIGYVSAGTVEFLFDGREFYFMEMNTRLQVEHTVTEAVTGLDLVEWQLRIAAGERLPLEQDDIRLRGHAIEARVCAEDPDRDFLPSAGNLKLLQWPAAGLTRVDAGFETGDRVPDTYDSLLGKVVAWAPARDQAAAKLARALDQTCCVGVHTNERWLSRVLRSPRFLEVQHSIATLQACAAEFATPAEPEPIVLAMAAVAAFAAGTRHRAGAGGQGGSGPVNPWAIPDGFVPNLPASIRLMLVLGGRSHSADISLADGQPRHVTVDGQQKLKVSNLSLEGDTIKLDPVRARYFVDGAHIHLWTSGRHSAFLLDDPRTHEFTAAHSKGGLTTPLPGVVAAVNVQVGQTVAPGAVLMVIEAMKMEHAITAPFDGTVQAIHFARGDRVPEGSELLELAPANP